MPRQGRTGLLNSPVSKMYTVNWRFGGEIKISFFPITRNRVKRVGRDVVRDPPIMSKSKNTSLHLYTQSINAYGTLSTGP